MFDLNKVYLSHFKLRTVSLTTTSSSALLNLLHYDRASLEFAVLFHCCVLDFLAQLAKQLRNTFAGLSADYLESSSQTLSVLFGLYIVDLNIFFLRRLI